MPPAATDANCKVKHLVLLQARRGRSLQLWSLDTVGGASIEAILVSTLRPAWNTQLKWYSSQAAQA